MKRKLAAEEIETGEDAVAAKSDQVCLESETLLALPELHNAKLRLLMYPAKGKR